MYLNAEFEIPILKKAASARSFKFFQNVNTMEQIQKVCRFSCFIFNFKYKKGIRFGKGCHIIPALLSDAGRTSVPGCVLFSYESD